MGLTARDQLILLADARGLLTSDEIRSSGIHSQIVTRLVSEGLLERVTRGLYRLAGRDVTEHHGLVLAAAAVPRGVICLLSALSFHGLGSQLPAQVWIAIPRGSRTPVLDYPPVRVTRLGGAAYSEGIQDHLLEGRNVRVYSVAKTVADCFKFRHEIGLDVAMEALREAWRDRRVSVEELEHAARACRVERVMRPYVEGVVA